MNSFIKTSSILLAAMIIAPAAMIVGLSAAAALGLSIALGLAAIAINDYRNVRPAYAATRLSPREKLAYAA